MIINLTQNKNGQVALNRITWVEGNADSMITSQQIKTALHHQQPVCFRIDEGAQQLTPFEFVERISWQFDNCLHDLTKQQIQQINFIYQPQWTSHLSRHQQLILGRLIQDALTDLFGQEVIANNITVGSVA